MRRLLHAVIAAAVSAAVLALLAFGYGPVPALGPALLPGQGAWTSAAGGRLPRSQELALPGLTHPVRVSFTSHGIASIRAADDADAFLALGYLHATFRLAEMDLERRLAEGRLAQLAGPSAVGSDKFELRLGLIRTARQEWAQMPKSSPAARALIAYARGVNDYLARARASRQWPALFSLTGVYPSAWTPVDSLAVQGDLTQELDFTTTPLDYALLERSLGAARTMAWFPVLPVSEQYPYDPGPYRRLGIAPLPAGAPLAVAARSGARPAGGRGPGPPGGPEWPGGRLTPHRACRGGGARAGRGAAARPGARVPGQQRLGGERPAGGGRRRAAGRRPAPAADPAIGVVSGRAVGPGPVGLRGQRARTARDPHRAEQAHRLVAHRHAEPGHALLRRADQPVQAGGVLLARPVAADAAGALHDRGARRARRGAYRGHYRSRAGPDPGRPDHGGGLDGQHALGGHRGDA